LSQRAPSIIVEGGEFPATEAKQLIAKLISMLQMGFIILLIFGEQIFGAIGRPVPDLLRNM